MLNAIRHFFETRVIETLPENPLQSRQVAAAALLVEVMVIDGKVEDAELKALGNTLGPLLNIDSSTVDNLIELSRGQVEEATSLYQFTSQVNQNFDHREKTELVTAMWQVALADGALDKYEENMIRRVAELLHLSHSEFIQCKFAARRDIN